MKLNLVLGNDWTAWYLDGMKLIEGHSVPARTLLQELQSRLDIDLPDVIDVTDEQFERLDWYLPEQLDDLMKER